VRDDGPAPDDAPPTDPFPEDVLRARLWGADASLAEYATYHRSRIRLTRSIAVLAPAAGAAMIAQLLTARQPLEATIVRASVLTAYGLAFVLALWPRRAFGAVGAVPLLFGTELPRTGTLAETDGREAFEALLGGTIKEANEVSGAAPRPLRRPLLLTLLRHDASVQLAALLLAIAAWRGTTTGAVELGRPIALLALGTALVTLLFGWTWWRVTRTFYDLLEDLPATSAAPPRKD
jgi:hypothetical protein